MKRLITSNQNAENSNKIKEPIEGIEKVCSMEKGVKAP